MEELMVEKEMSAIERARAARRAEREKQQKKSKNTTIIQRTLGFVLLAGVIGGGYTLASAYSPKLAAICLVGLLLGVSLQRGRFCFTAAVRDPMLTGGTLLSKAAVVTIAVASVGFVALQYSAATKGQALPGFIKPVGLHTILGGLLFGIGMVLAGGCASGTLMRIGEGFTQQFFALSAFICGCMIAVPHMPFWKETSVFTLHTPTALGWFPAIGIHFCLLLTLYFVLEKFGRWRVKKLKESR